MDRMLKKITGVALMLVGGFGMGFLSVAYMLVLFSADTLFPVNVQRFLRDMVFNPEGVIAATAFYVLVFIPFFVCFLIGRSIVEDTHFLRFSLLLVLGITWVTALFLASMGTVLQVQQLLLRIDPFTPQVSPEVQEGIPQSVRETFRVTLKSEVNRTQGMPIEGYEPQMFLAAFPGLTETDFEGVEASIGHYTVEQGRLVHKPDNTRLVHSAAQAITDRGMDMLLANISVRLRIDLQHGGTLTQIMEALARAQSEEIPEEVSCTLEAKICPDGTAVGRQGPSCEFAPCL